MNKYKYLLCPGYTGDNEYISLTKLIRLYDVDPSICLIIGAEGSDDKSLIKLTPFGK
jgi:hypothetical protein